jgi:hypothetical protein
MRILIIVVQLLISVFVTASVMPVILVTFPAAQHDKVGLSIMAAILAVTFLLVALVWPKKK